MAALNVFYWFAGMSLTMFGMFAFALPDSGSLPMWRAVIMSGGVIFFLMAMYA